MLRDQELTTVLYDTISGISGVVEEGHRQSNSRIVMKNRPESHCGYCQHGMVYTLKSSNRTQVFCRKINSSVPPDIETCNVFVPLGQVDLWELTRTATLIDKPKSDGGHYF